MPRPTFFNLPADKRQRIIDAAVEEFGTRPFARATLDRIVERAGIAKGSVYQYFEGKVDLYAWLVTEHFPQAKLAAIGADAPPASASVWEVLERAFLAGARFSIEQPAFTRLGVRFLRDRDTDPQLRALWEHNERAKNTWLRQLVIRGQARGELRADLDVGVASGFIAHALGEGILEQLAHRVGLTLEAFLDAPHAMATLDEQDLLGLVRAVTRLLRQGAEVRKRVS